MRQDGSKQTSTARYPEPVCPPGAPGSDSTGRLRSRRPEGTDLLGRRCPPICPVHPAGEGS